MLAPTMCNEYHPTISPEIVSGHRPPMDNGKCIMDNDCIAFGDDFKLFPKEIPQLSIIHYQLSIINYPFARQCVSYSEFLFFTVRI